MLETPFTRALSLSAPIMQAPIGAAAGPDLAAAVSNAGGLGSLAAWWLPVEPFAASVRRTAALTSNRFSVNLRADLDQADHLRAALDAGARVVHLFWGSPRRLAPLARDAGAMLLATVADTDEAKEALDAGADVLVAQGWEAGGHVRGTVTTLALVPAVVDVAGQVPVLACGGIVDGRGLAAALMLGAAGAVMGTRFAASVESFAHADYKRALVAARQVDAVYVQDAFELGWPDAPHRVLRNSTLSAWEEAGRPSRGSRPGENEIVATRPDGSHVLRYSNSTPSQNLVGNAEAMALYAGQGVQTIAEILPAARLIETIVADARARLTGFH